MLCHFDYDIWWPDICSSIILDASVRVVFNEICVKISGLGKALVAKWVNHIQSFELWKRT